MSSGEESLEVVMAPCQRSRTSSDDGDGGNRTRVGGPTSGDSAEDPDLATPDAEQSTSEQGHKQTAAEPEELPFIPPRPTDGVRRAWRWLSTARPGNSRSLSLRRRLQGGDTGRPMTTVARGHPADKRGPRPTRRGTRAQAVRGALPRMRQGDLKQGAELQPALVLGGVPEMVA
jgi:hypothetical protein